MLASDIPGENCGDISRLLSRSIAAEISRYFTQYAAIYRDSKIVSAIAPRYFRDSMIAHIVRGYRVGNIICGQFGNHPVAIAIANRLA